MIDRARVTIWLHRLFCHEGYEGVMTTPAGQRFGFIGPEPYLWPVLFAVDGRDALIRSPEDDEGTGGELVLGGRASIQKTVGGPDNMGAHGFKMMSGDEARVPGTTGYFTRESPALRLPFPCDPLKPEGALGSVGLAVALFDHDELPHDSIRAGYDTFAVSLQKEISDVIDGASIIGAGDLTQDELDSISERIGENVRSTVVSSLSTWEKIKFGFGFSNADDEIGSAVFTFDLPGLVEDVARVERKPIEKSLGLAANGVEMKQRWELEVIAIATRFPPAQAVFDVARMHGIAVDEDKHAEVAAGRLIGPWAELLGDLHAPLLGEMVLDRDVARAAVDVVIDAQVLAARPDLVVTKDMADRATAVLVALGERGDPRTARVAGRAARVARGLVGRPAKLAERPRRERRSDT